MASRRQKGKDGAGGEMELGILTPHALYVYDLGTGRVSARVKFPLAPAPTSAVPKEGYGYGARQSEGEAEQVGTPSGFEVAEQVVVVTTHTPPALIILARPSLHVLHVFPASTLAVPLPVPHAHRHQQASTSDSTSLSPSSVSPPPSAIRDAVAPTSPTRTPTLSSWPGDAPRAAREVQAQAPTPISALHGRLLAFLATPPIASPSISALSPSSPTSSALSNSGIGGANTGEGWGRTLGRFFSRSAPAAAASALMVLGAATGASPPSAGAGGGGVSGLVGAALAGGGIAAGSGGGAGAWVRVVDLGPLLGGGRGAGRGMGGEGAARPRDVHVFEAGRAPLGGLAFAEDGTQVFAVRRDGLGAGVWALRPAPSPLCSSAASPSLSPHAAPTAHTNDLNVLPTPTHLYALRRGRTGAVVKAVAGTRDGRFVALATRRRTVHVFAVNPYGGARGCAEPFEGAGGGCGGSRGYGPGGAAGEGSGEGGTTEVHALVRIRLPQQQQQHLQHEGESPRAPPAPLAIAFVPAAAAGSTSTLRSPSAPASPSAHGVQDVLVFDPADDVLSLRRITLSALEAPHSAISVSLPAAVGRLSMSASPPVGSFARGAAATGRAVTEAPVVELGGTGGGGGDVDSGAEEGVGGDSEGEGGGCGGGGSCGEAGERGHTDREMHSWLAQAELSTFTSAPRRVDSNNKNALRSLNADAPTVSVSPTRTLRKEQRKKSAGRVSTPAKSTVSPIDPAHFSGLRRGALFYFDWVGAGSILLALIYFDFFTPAYFRP
ncbi:hypothetical protein B0H14DRAFT_2567374 [Mycena olivaceomarginata]|nr:hypothetical protein B0H14DRAFT_2567374 [Mycena olivaceomarginata]